MNYEPHLWAAFPKADEVVVQQVDGKTGIGVRFGDYRKGIAFNPRRVKLERAIKQLRGLILMDLA